ncbi:phospholipase D family protein [Thioalkalivibrio sp. AKL8]|uniref:phospholipase D family protein n=1 Tax=Thioalkalivibrio sp. AKL8 TaxID=1158156 RepID=UPI0003765C77|nr:phospholipase D family protein [Thioalkalivibrio sp. AKL8]
MSDSQDSSQWSHLPLLDVLRPPAGAQVTDAILSTFSLDLTVMVSALLALAGRDDLDGGGSKVGLATALQHFGEGSGHCFRVLVQKGRIAAPSTSPQVLSLLDQFVRQVPRDPRQSSWHAKAALVRVESSGDTAGSPTVEWRLWIGSRNLTRDISWDSGLVLIGRPGSEGDTPVGLQTIAEGLFANALDAEQEKNLREQLSDELKLVRWEPPAEVESVRRIEWLNGAQGWEPELPTDADELVVVSPFFTLETLNRLAAKAPAADRSLLSTPLEMDRRLRDRHKQLPGWALWTLQDSWQTTAEPFEAEEEPLDASVPSEGGMDEVIPLGLHAKLIATRKGGSVSLWMGSANVTRRGWSANAEIVVELTGGIELLNAVKTLFQEASEVLEDGEGKPEPTPRDRLEQLRDGLSALEFCQVSDPDGVTIHVETARPLAVDLADFELSGVELDVGPLGAPESAYVLWPLGQASVQIPIEELNLAGQTELLRFRLRDRSRVAPDAAGIQLHWVLFIPIASGVPRDRDRRLLSRYLTPHQYLDWVHGLLEGYDLDPVAWDGEVINATGVATSGSGRPVAGRPTVEALLKVWQRAPESLQTVHEALERYLDDKTLEERADDAAGREAFASIKAFREQLNKLKSALGGDRR